MNRFVAVGLLFSLGITAFADDSSQPALGATPSQGASKEVKLQEARRLEAEARKITLRLGELASSGKLPTSEEAIELMRKMLEEMSAIRRQIEALEGDVAVLKSRPAPKPAANDGAVVGGYLQTQYRDTNQTEGANDAFAIRRMRLGITKDLNPRTSVKISAELATGTNQTQSQLRDAFITYRSDPNSKGPAYQFQAGQMPLPIGYELKRSSSDREFPERAVYNQKLFNGERSRGLQVNYEPMKGIALTIGGFNSMTINDPEQSSKSPGPENRLAITGGVRVSGERFEFGVSGLVGERPQFASGTGNSAVNHPRVDRELFYVDGLYRGFLDPKLTLRGEAMVGRDRVPVSGSPATVKRGTDLAGFQIQADYLQDSKNRFHLRWEQFDPNRRAAGDALNGWGLAWSHYLSPELKLTAAQEWFEDLARASMGQKRYHVTTLRIQLKY